MVSTLGPRTKQTLKRRALREYFAFSIQMGQPMNLWSSAFLQSKIDSNTPCSLMLQKPDYALATRPYGLSNRR